MVAPYRVFVLRGSCMRGIKFLLIGRSVQPVPAEHRANFKNLYLDIAGYSVLAGSALNFVTVYAARLGATAFQLGLFNAGPAAVNLLLTLPAGRWLEKRPVDKAVFWTALVQRSGYLLWALLPFFLGASAQIWALIGLTLLGSIPATALTIGFNALFAGAVPPEWRGRVAGVRNALSAVIFIITSLVSGRVLTTLGLPVGYQLVFGVGFLGALLSSVYLKAVHPLVEPVSASAPVPTPPARRPRLIRLDILRTPFARVLAGLFAFHLVQYIPMSLFPLYQVGQLHLSDQQISLGTALFYVMVFLGSLQLERLTRRLGNRRLVGLGATLLSGYPALLSLSRGVGLFLVTSAVGGLAWSLLGAAVGNYLLEKVPAEDRPAHLAWYNLALNGAILLASLLGPLLGEWLTVGPALAAAALLRLLVALVLLRWG